VASAFSPPNEVFAAQGGAHLLYDALQDHIPLQQSGVVVKRSSLTQDGQTVINVMKATVEAMHRMKTDPEFTKGIFKKYLKTDDQAVIDSAYSFTTSIFQNAPYPSKDGLAEAIREVSTDNPDAKNVTPQQCMDISIVKELEDSGFIKQIYGA
jgi:ABC-type nitrate/sulfonate/bicarbonate transport system substrate-binding protein